jgi:hypothetical protein
MINSFSERQGIIKPTTLNEDEMPIALRNRLWNSVREEIKDQEKLIEFLWGDFFKQPTDTLYGRGYINQIKEKFYALEWYQVYDFLEVLLFFSRNESFVEHLNYTFDDERAPYKIIAGSVTPLISGLEAKEVEKAIEGVGGKYSDVSNLIKKALEFYSGRPADYQNSIKESISAIEALAKIVLNKESATLSALADQLNVHFNFRKAIKELYNWTSAEANIRHGGSNKELKSDEQEARFMLVTCSAFVNYIISKYEK